MNHFYCWKQVAVRGNDHGPFVPIFQRIGHHLKRDVYVSSFFFMGWIESSTTVTSFFRFLKPSVDNIHPHRPQGLHVGSMSQDRLRYPSRQCRKVGDPPYRIPGTNDCFSQLPVIQPFAFFVSLFQCVIDIEPVDIKRILGHSDGLPALMEEKKPEHPKRPGASSVLPEGGTYIIRGYPEKNNFILFFSSDSAKKTSGSGRLVCRRNIQRTRRVFRAPATHPSHR